MKSKSKKILTLHSKSDLIILIQSVPIEDHRFSSSAPVCRRIEGVHRVHSYLARRLDLQCPLVQTPYLSYSIYYLLMDKNCRFYAMSSSCLIRMLDQSQVRLKSFPPLWEHILCLLVGYRRHYYSFVTPLPVNRCG